jgi:hypothetical protein
MSDLYFKVAFGMSGTQATDIHFRAQNGKGSFNWRVKFPIELPLKGEGAGRLSVQVSPALRFGSVWSLRYSVKPRPI